MKIIGLYGTHDIGKTTTLNKLIDLLSLIANNYEIDRSYDTFAYFVINEKNIVVCTPGDNKEAIENNIEFLEKHDCDVFVTATRTKGKTVNGIEKLTKKKSAELIWVEKEDNELKNTVIAGSIFGLIMQEINPDFENSVYRVEENQ